MITLAIIFGVGILLMLPSALGARRFPHEEEYDDVIEEWATEEDLDLSREEDNWYDN